jgi:hypothetical protein
MGIGAARSQPPLGADEARSWCHKISRGRALELLHGAATAEDLPAEDRVPLESMRAQLDLD